MFELLHKQKISNRTLPSVQLQFCHQIQTKYYENLTEQNERIQRIFECATYPGMKDW